MDLGFIDYLKRIIIKKENRIDVVMSFLGLIGLFIFFKGIISGIWINPWNLFPSFLIGPIGVSLGLVVVATVFLTPFWTIIALIVIIRDYLKNRY